MDMNEAERRDQVLRAFFEGKSWDDNEEFKLKRHLVLNSASMLPGFPLVVDDEWEFVPGQTNHGRGDLVFTDGKGAFAVVEVKFIDLGRTGKTARKKRTDSRGKVVEQALRYANIAVERYAASQPVRAFTYTNEGESLVDVGTSSNAPSAG